MMIRFSFASAVVCAALFSFGGSFDGAGCRVKWSETSLTVSNDLFSRTYAADGDALATRSWTVGTKELIATNRLTRVSGRLEVSARAARRSPVGETGVEVRVKTGGCVRTLWLYQSVAGVLLEDPASVTLKGFALPSVASGKFYEDESALRKHLLKGADPIRLKAIHAQATEFDLHDMTDIVNEVLRERSWLVRECQSVAAPVLAVEDLETHVGVVCLRFAPLVRMRPDSLTPNYLVSWRDWKPNLPWLASVPNGYPVAEIAYAGGAVGRQVALVAIQRALRPYVAGRDGIFLSNTWGDGNHDARINAAFMRAEVEAGARLGVDVIQIDDGWQRGRSRNSALIKRQSDGVWGNFRSNPEFWKPDGEKFPEGLGPIVALARAKGLSFGLWFGPDSSNDCASWNQDADTLLAFYRDLGIRYFKIDSLIIDRKEAFANSMRMFERMLRESNGEMVFDLDVTGAVRRPGYFGVPDIGPLFVENRYGKHQSYWPHMTLRNAWSLAKVVDPVRLRMEVLNPLHYADAYPASPLAPAKWRGDSLFAIAMNFSPLGWFEISELAPSTVDEMRPLIARWKAERARLHGGVTFPIGTRPDGFSWAGFVTRAADGRGGYVLFFRELAAEDGCTIALAPYLTAITSAEVIGGRGTATLSGNQLNVRIPEKLDYIWVKIK